MRNAGSVSSAGALPSPRARRSIRGPVEELGGLAALALRTAVSAARPPYAWGADAVRELGTAARRCLLPLALSAFAVGYAVLGMQPGAILHETGALERVGGFLGRFSSSQGAPLVAAVVVAAAAGASMCVELAAREARSELDALDVLGVDLIKHLVVPRVVALAVLTPLLAALAQQVEVLGGLLASRSRDLPSGMFLYTLFNSAVGPTGVFALCLKGVLFGVLVGVVACFKGMSASTRPDGVGRAVSEAMVITLVGVFGLNYLFSYVLAALTPELNVVI